MNLNVIKDIDRVMTELTSSSGKGGSGSPQNSHGFYPSRSKARPVGGTPGPAQVRG